MTIRHVIKTIIPEKSTGVITWYIKDENGTVIPTASLTTIVMTLYVKDAIATIINSRNAQSILNVNNGTVHATSGLCTWAYQTADTAIQVDNSTESHVALITYTWNSGAKTARNEIEFTVSNLLGVT